MEYRIEHDTLGEVKVPADHMWGAQTQRSSENFKIGARMPEEIIHAFAVLKKCTALANLAEGKLSEEKAKVIAEACDEILAGKWNGEFPLVVYQTGSGTQSNMNMNEVVAHIANAKLEAVGSETRIHPNDDVNMSQSSNDTFPTAMHVAAVSVLHRCLYQPLAELIATFHKKSEEYMHVVKIGRTHVQDAVPLTFGQEVSGWTTMLEKCQHMIEASEKYLLGLAIGGTAVGTGLNAPKDFGTRVSAEIAKETGLPFVSEENKFYALTGRDDFVFAHGALEALAMDCMKIADDLRLLAGGPRAGLGELTIPANEPGSSIMPGKVNPVIAEVLDQACYQVIGNDLAVSMGVENGQFELNVMEPVMAFNMFNSMKYMTNAVNTFVDKLLIGLEPNREQCQKWLDNSVGVVTALLPHIGYENSAMLAKEAYNTGKPIRQVIMEKGLLSREKMEHILSPRQMTTPGIAE